MWLNEFKVALVQKDTDKIDLLLSDIPQFETLDEMKEASFLLKEAHTLLQLLRNEAKGSLVQLKKNIEFLESTHLEAAPKLNIKL